MCKAQSCPSPKHPRTSQEIEALIRAEEEQIECEDTQLLNNSWENYWKWVGNAPHEKD